MLPEHHTTHTAIPPQAYSAQLVAILSLPATCFRALEKPALRII